MATPYVRDGTRRFSEHLGTGSPMSQLRARTDVGWETIGVAFVRPDYPTDYTEGFLNYDGTYSFEPVNQFFYSNRSLLTPPASPTNST